MLRKTATRGGRTVPLPLAQSFNTLPGSGDATFAAVPQFRGIDADAPSNAIPNNQNSTTSGTGHENNMTPRNNNERGDYSGGFRRPTYPMRGHSGDKPAYVPRSRTVDDIYADDATRACACAANLYESDAEVKVFGGGENIVVIDEWSDAGFAKEILENIQLSKYARPRVFQKYVMPHIMEGKDVKGQAETGSGKSAAFLLPIINNLMKKFAGTNRYERRCKVAALIIEPTRELAKQLYEQASKFARNTGVSVNYTYGGYCYTQNMSNIHLAGCDILVATPSRLAHMVFEGDLKISDLQYLVLDEADCLMDYKFINQLDGVFNSPHFPPPDKRQTMFFSATFTKEILDLASTLCRADCVLVKNENKVNKRVHQAIVEVPVNARNEYLLNYLRKKTDENNGVTPKHLVFVETKRQADLVASMLATSGIRAMTVNGDRPQQWRDETTAQFCAGNLRVVVATSVMARGLDILDLGIVINMYLPADHHVYIHRVGRTGRISEGFAIAYFDPEYSNDRQIAKSLIEELNNAGVPVPEFVSRALEPLFKFGADHPEFCDGFEKDCGVGGSNSAKPSAVAFAEMPKKVSAPATMPHDRSNITAFAELPVKVPTSEALSNDRTNNIAFAQLPTKVPEFGTLANDRNNNVAHTSFSEMPPTKNAAEFSALPRNVNSYESSMPQKPNQFLPSKFPTKFPSSFANPPRVNNNTANRFADLPQKSYVDASLPNKANRFNAPGNFMKTEHPIESIPFGQLISKPFGHRG